MSWNAGPHKAYGLPAHPRRGNYQRHTTLTRKRLVVFLSEPIWRRIGKLAERSSLSASALVAIELERLLSRIEARRKG